MYCSKADKRMRHSDFGPPSRNPRRRPSLSHPLTVGGLTFSRSATSSTVRISSAVIVGTPPPPQGHDTATHIYLSTMNDDGVRLSTHFYTFSIWFLLTLTYT